MPTPNLPPDGGAVVPFTFLVAGQRAATVNGIIRFLMPFRGRFVGASYGARAIGGTSPVVTVDVLDDGVSLQASARALTAGAAVEPTLAANTVVEDESVMTVNLALSGTSPNVDDVTIVLNFVPL